MGRARVQGEGAKLEGAPDGGKTGGRLARCKVAVVL